MMKHKICSSKQVKKQKLILKVSSGGHSGEGLVVRGVVIKPKQEIQETRK